MVHFSSGSWTRHAPLLLVVLLAAVVQLSTLDAVHGWGDDFMAYYSQAKSLTHGTVAEVTAANRYTVEHSSYPFGPVAYPWGLPILLAPIVALKGLNLLWLKVPGVVSLIGLIPLLWFGLKARLSYPSRLVVCALVALSPYLQQMNQSIQSDIPFLFASTASLLGIELFRRPLGERRGHPLLHLGLGLLIAFAFSLRTNGLFLMAALACMDGIRILSLLKQRELPGKPLVLQTVLPYVGFLAFTLPVMAALPDGGSSHISHFHLFEPWVIRYNLGYYIESFAEFFVALPHPHLVWGACIPFVMLGLLREIKHLPATLVYTGLTIALFLVWPWREGLRYLVPLLPVVLFLLVAGGEAVWEATDLPMPRLRRGLLLTSMLIMLAAFALRATRIAGFTERTSTLNATGPFSPAALELYRVIQETTPPDAVMVFFKPRLMREMTGRNAVMLQNIDELKPGMWLCLNRYHDQTLRISDEAFQASAWFEEATAYPVNDQFSLYRLAAEKRTPFR